MNQPGYRDWNRGELKNPHLLGDKAQRVQRMFGAIAPRYDLLNHLLSLGQDLGWRRRGVQLAQVGPGERVLDLCCGTGDMALAFAASGAGAAEIVGVDFSEEMLAIARRKYRKFILKGGGCGAQCRRAEEGGHCNPVQMQWLQGDALAVDFADGSFDCVSCVFGWRNLQDPVAGMREMHRLLRPGGRAVILEFTMPDNAALKWAYQCYLRALLPLCAGMMSGSDNRAYDYLPASVASFASTEEQADLVRAAGFENVRVERLSFGVVIALVAEKK